MDWKYILNRVIIGVAIAVIIMLIKGNLLIGVSAQTISMPSPDTFGYWNCLDDTCSMGSSGQYTSTQAYATTYNQLPVYRGTLLYPRTNGGVAYEWTGANLCINDDLTVSGNVYAPSVTSITFASGYFNSWNQMKSCDFYPTGTYQTYHFTCSGTGGGGFVLYFGYLNQAGFGGYTYLERDLNVYCNATANDIINNANNNTTQIINNNNENTQQIINSITGGAEATIDSQYVCSVIDKNKVIKLSKYLANDGLEHDTSDSHYGVTDYIKINKNTKLKVIENFLYQNACFYNINKEKISCIALSSLSNNSYISIPNNAEYFRTTIFITTNKPQFEICNTGNQALQDSITDDSIDSSTGNDFFDGFNYGDDSLSAVITAPLRFFNTLTTSCSPLSLSVFNQSVVIPCGDTVFWSKSEVSNFRTWWNLFFGGIAIYYLGLKLFKVVHDAIDPEKDNIESVGV